MEQFLRARYLDRGRQPGADLILSAHKPQCRREIPRAKALATTPTDDLLALPMLQLDQGNDSLHSYAILRSRSPLQTAINCQWLHRSTFRLGRTRIDGPALEPMKRSATAVMAACCALWMGAQAAPPPRGTTYVALGSSYAAGTGLKKRAVDSPAGCGQGTDNYPRQVARAFKLKLVDRSCGGATTRDVLDGGQFGLPPQLDAVNSETRFVTITIGGNDVRFVADLGLFSCAHRPQDVPEPARKYACASAADFTENVAFASLEANMREIAQQIRQHAPQARMVFVDYITVLPAAGTCADLALSQAEAAAMRARAGRLAELTAKVAAENGADLIAASKLSEAHDVCSARPWAWGFVPNYDPATSRAIPFHPRLAGTTAIAKAIIRRLKRAAAIDAAPST